MMGKVPLQQPKVPARRYSLSSETLIGTIIDLLKSTLSPIERENLFNRDFRKKSCLESPSIIISILNYKEVICYGS